MALPVGQFKVFVRALHAVQASPEHAGPLELALSGDTLWSIALLNEGAGWGGSLDGDIQVCFVNEDI